MSKRILIVDSPAGAEEYMETFVLQSGCHVEIAHNRQEALEQTGEKFDAIILDFTENQGDRSAIYFDLITLPTLHSAPIIFLANAKTEGGVQKLIQRPIDKVLLRPIAGDVLAKRTREALKLPKRRRIELLVRFYKLGDNDPFPIRAKTQNISSEGMFALTQKDLDIGTKVKIVLTPPETGDPIELTGVIRRKEMMGQDVGYGIEFLEYISGNVAGFQKSYGVDLMLV